MFGGVAATGAATGASAATLPQDQAELMFHVYDGGGVKADGPAVLLRKSLADKVSLSAQYYVDAVSNASIDVVTTASPFREKRTAVDVGADWLVRDSIVTLGYSRSDEPDYLAEGFSADVSHEVFGGMTTVSLGFTRSRDRVGQKNVIGWIDSARHWQYRVGLTQILTPRWLASANFELVSDEGFLGSPYRAARVFGATVPERNPRTRTSRAVKLRTVADTGALLSRSSVRAELRTYWDTWDIRATTWELGAARHLGPRWLMDVFVRRHAQDKALFYSDNAQTETRYVSRNRQLSTFTDDGFGAKLTYTLPGLRPGFEARITGSFELKRFRFADFTDLRTGAPYRYDARVWQLVASGTF